MIRLHSTKKLSAKLPVNSQGLLARGKASSDNSPQTIEALNPLSGWHANLIMIQRRNCILLVHDETRFVVFMTGLTKPDFADLNQHFATSFLGTLTALGASENQLVTARKLLQPLVIDTETSRSTLGTLNQSKAMIEHIIWDDNASIMQLNTAELAARLCTAPVLVKRADSAIFPVRAMLKLLDDAEQSFGRSANTSDSGPAAGNSNKVVSLTDFKAAKKTQ